MTWKRFFRWFLRAAFACLGLFIIIAGIVWYMIHAARAERWRRSYEGHIATALGWEQRDDLEKRLKAQPTLLLSLLGHDSQRVRQAAQLFLESRRYQIDEATLDSIAAEIRDPDGVARGFLVKLLASYRRDGVRRVADFYRSTEVVKPELQAAIEGAVENPLSYSNDDLIQGLIGIVRDDAVMVGNRCRAIAALGYLRMPDKRHEATDGRFAVIASLRDCLTGVSEPVATAVASALLHIDEEAARAKEMVQSEKAGEFRNLGEDGGEAIAALADQSDWHRVGAAADALALNGVIRAIPELQKVAESHWYRPVRRTAQRAVRVLHGKEPYLPEVDEKGRFKTPLQDLGWYIEDEIKEWGNRSNRERSTSSFRRIGGELLRECRGYFFPLIHEVEFRRPGRLPKRMALEDAGIQFLRPQCAVSFAGGKLLGFNQGEWGCGLVFYRKGEIPQYLAPAGVTDFIPMPFGMLVLAFHEGVLVAKQSTDGSLNVVSLPKALPIGFGMMGPPRMMPNGELKTGCIGVDVYITPTGDVRFVEQSPAESSR
ncbi:MAG: hypothetical protein IPL39_13910 [Opitutaceae bacterium]|nr:hypothetical protein [Opitutaceae bacterium]